MDDVWLEQHASVLFELDERGRITRPNESDPETDAPRVFLARGLRSGLIVFRADVRDDIASRLAEVATELAPWDGQPTDSQTLAALREAVREWLGEAGGTHGPAFRFGEGWLADMAEEAVVIDERNGHLLDPHFPYTRSVLSWRAPVVGIVRDEAVVSACYSARRTATAAEAGVDTVEPYRGRGLAVAVASAWAAAADRAGFGAPLQHLGG
jgi:hypothetical protein